MQKVLDTFCGIPYSTSMDEKTFQRSVSADMNTIVRLQRERREVCWICMGKGTDLYGVKCIYCAGIGSVHVEVRQ